MNSIQRYNIFNIPGLNQSHIENIVNQLIWRFSKRASRWKFIFRMDVYTKILNSLTKFVTNIENKVLNLQERRLRLPFIFTDDIIEYIEYNITSHSTKRKKV